MIDLSMAKPILFNIEMVQAILEGRKTQTRLAIKPQPVMDETGMWDWKDCQWMDGGLGFPESGIDDHAPYQPGDILWVRETFTKYFCSECEGDLQGECFANEDQKGDGHCWIYKADGVTLTGDGKWSPAVHMPRDAARLFLRVTDVRVEQVQDITDDDAIAEGVGSEAMGQGFGKYYYSSVWDDAYAKKGYEWHKNPWCWRICFERIKEGK